MLRFVCSLFLGIIVLILGLEKVIAYKKRQDILKIIENLFAFIKENVRLYNANYKEIIANIVENDSFSDLTFFKEMNERLKNNEEPKLAFEVASKNWEKGKYLKESDLKMLRDFMLNCQNYDFGLFYSKCEKLEHGYNVLYEDANDEFIKKGKLYTTLSVIGSLFIFILII